jgi:hypothetical protein
MIFEMRFYAVTHGRTADANLRFTGQLPELFSRHDVQCVGAWNALSGPGTPRFVYLLAYRDFAHREAAWTSFYADPQWAKVRAETNAGHEMIEQHDLFFLKANVAWQLETASLVTSAGEVHEIIMQQIAPGKNSAVNEFLNYTWLHALRKEGGRNLGIFDMVSGYGMPQIVMINAWPDMATWQRGRLSMDLTGELQQAFDTQRHSLGQPLFGRTELNLLAPVAGVVIHPTLGRIVLDPIKVLR